MKNMNLWCRFTPWKILLRRFFAAEHFQPELFTRKHNLDLVMMKQLHAGQRYSFWPELCVALSKELGVSIEMLQNLSDQFHTLPPSRPTAAALPQGNRGSFYLSYSEY